MMTETALAQAMKQAGVNTNAALVRCIAQDELHKARRLPQRALAPFMAELRDAGGLMAEVISEASLRADALAYLAGVAADMRGDKLKVPARAGDGVPRGHGSHVDAGPVESSESEGSSSPMESRPRIGPSPSDSVPSRDGGGVHMRGESHIAFGSPESREVETVRASLDDRQREGGPSSSPQVSDGAVHSCSDGREVCGRVVAIPNKPRGLAALQTHAALNTIYDTYLLLNGAKIGDLVWSALPRMAMEDRKRSSAHAQQAALLGLVHGHVTPADPNARVRHLIKVVDLQRMIQKAAEISNGC